jgi:hypothetical protein
VTAILGIAATIAPCSAAIRLEVIPESPVEGSALTVRAVGPFVEPAPSIQLRTQGHDVVVQLYFEDYVSGPFVPFVAASMAAPAAGAYRLLLETCAGNVPPGEPSCHTTTAGTFQIVAAPRIPGPGPMLLGMLAAVMLLLSRRALSASNAP